MIGKLIGKLVIWGLLSVFVGVVALGGYFYYKAGQPMQVAAAQRLAPGITYREFWADRIQHWNEIDDQNANKGKGKSCVLVSTIMLPMMYTGSSMKLLIFAPIVTRKLPQNFCETLVISRRLTNLFMVIGGNYPMPGGGKSKTCHGGIIIAHSLEQFIAKLALPSSQLRSKDSILKCIVRLNVVL